MLINSDSDSDSDSDVCHDIEGQLAKINAIFSTIRESLLLRDFEEFSNIAELVKFEDQTKGFEISYINEQVINIGTSQVSAEILAKLVTIEKEINKAVFFFQIKNEFSSLLSKVIVTESNLSLINSALGDQETLRPLGEKFEINIIDHKFVVKRKPETSLPNDEEIKALAAALRELKKYLSNYKKGVFYKSHASSFPQGLSEELVVNQFSLLLSKFVPNEDNLRVIKAEISDDNSLYLLKIFDIKLVDKVFIVSKETPSDFPQFDQQNFEIILDQIKLLVENLSNFSAKKNPSPASAMTGASMSDKSSQAAK